MAFQTSTDLRNWSIIPLTDPRVQLVSQSAQGDGTTLATYRLTLTGTAAQQFFRAHVQKN